MPYIDIDIDADDFYRSCSRRERHDLARWLTEDGYLNNGFVSKYGEKSPIQHMFEGDIYKIKENYLQLSQEDLELISKIAKKY